jgi:hypothetical protein
LTRKLNLALLLLLVFVGVPFGWLLLDASVSGAAVKAISIAQLRQLADSMPGDRPKSLRYELIAQRRFVSDVLAAGSGLRPVPYGIRAYQLVFPSGPGITVDRGMSRVLADENDLRDFDPEAQSIVDRAVASSRLNLTLSADVEHTGRTEVAPAFGSGRGVGPDPASAANTQAPYAVARGVVVLPADGVAPGRRMVYVRLASGQELILAGDIAPVRTSWQEMRPPARMTTSFLGNDDREETASWLRTLGKLKAAAPGLEIVPGHDSLVPRVLVHGFTTDPRLRRFAHDKRLALQAMMR